MLSALSFAHYGDNIVESQKFNYACFVQRLVFFALAEKNAANGFLRFESKRADRTFLENSGVATKQKLFRGWQNRVRAIRSIV
jgi:hypothetical protein